MISVVIPTYNRAGHLKRAIDSVVAQAAACREIIVVDDGSVDHTPELVAVMRKSAKVPVRYFYQENKGAAAARNKGIELAREEVLCFLDSDDRFAPGKLAVQWRAMRKNPHYLISHTREIWYRRGKILNQKKKHAPPHGEIFARCLAMCVVGMSTVMVRRELFSRYGMFDERLVCCEDYDLWLRVSARERFLLVDQPLTLKDGGRPDQLSVIHRLGMDKYRIRAICNLLDSGCLTREQDELAVRELARKCEIYGNGCLKHGRAVEGRAYLDIPGKYPMASAPFK